MSHLQNQDIFLNGGWWHDERILEATGEGVEKEEPRAWEGWWNEQVVCIDVVLKTFPSDTSAGKLSGAQHAAERSIDRSVNWPS